MSAMQSALPGLFSPSAQVSHISGMEPIAAIKLVASVLLSALQHCACDPAPGSVDRKVSEDPRYRVAVSQAVTLSIWLDDRAAKAALDRNAFLTHHLRLRGKAGLPGLLAQAALVLGQAVQAANDPELPTRALDLIEQAIIGHAMRHGLDPRAARGQPPQRLQNAPHAPAAPPPPPPRRPAGRPPGPRLWPDTGG